MGKNISSRERRKEKMMSTNVSHYTCGNLGMILDLSKPLVRVGEFHGTFQEFSLIKTGEDIYSYTNTTTNLVHFLKVSDGKVIDIFGNSKRVFIACAAFVPDNLIPLTKVGTS